MLTLYIHTSYVVHTELYEERGSVSLFMLCNRHTCPPIRQVKSIYLIQTQMSFETTISFLVPYYIITRVYKDNRNLPRVTTLQQFGSTSGCTLHLTSFSLHPSTADGKKLTFNSVFFFVYLSYHTTCCYVLYRIRIT